MAVYSYNKTFQRVIFIALIISGILLGLVWVKRVLQHHHSTLQQVQDNYETLRKAEVKTIIDELISEIEFHKYEVENQLKKSIAEKMRTALAVVESIYWDARDKRSEDDVKNLIIKTLMSMHLFEGRGYYWVHDTDHTLLAHPHRHLSIGQNDFHYRDSLGNFVIQDMVKTALTSPDGGFISYSWINPQVPDLKENSIEVQKKIAFVQLFEPYNWVIGVAEYVEDVTAQTQESMIKRIAQIRYGEAGYIFNHSREGVNLNHIEQSNIGKNRWDLSDASGLKIVQELDRVGRQPGGGFLEYYASIDPRTQLPAKKISYIRSVDDWGWVLGGGVYLEDIHQQVAQLKAGMTHQLQANIWVAIIALMVTLIVIYFIFREFFGRFSRELHYLTTKDASGAIVPINVDRFRIQELHEIATELGQYQDQSKQMEQALRESEERLSLGLNATNSGMWDWNLKTGGVYFDTTYFTVSGYEPDEFPHDYLEWEKRVHPDDVDRAKAAIEAYLSGKSLAFYVEFRFRKKDGTWSWILGQGRVFECDVAGNPIRFVGAHTDITERKRAEEEKEKLQAQLTQARKMESVGQLAGGVAHDFNNMLGVILGYAQLAMRKVGPDEPLYANLDEIRKAAERSANLTQQLLAFARQQTVAPKVLDINEAVNDMLNMLRRMIGEDMDLAWRPGCNLRSIFIDPSQMDQILTNLCVNARDAIANTGKITIETASVSFDDAYCADHAGFVPGEFVMLAVSDDGCGMNAETLSHLFEPFFSTKEMGKGTGLGLATVYGIVKQNNGFINVYSEPGHGTIFKIYLPQYAAKAAPRPEQELAPVLPAGGEIILLVEDEPAILEVTSMMLEEIGYAVIAAGSPGEAIRLARQHHGRIDLLMTDVVMPEMNGRDLAGNLISIYPEIKRLFMSGYTANVIAHHGVLDPGVHFLQKPFSIKDLATKIREALDHKEPDTEKG